VGGVWGFLVIVRGWLPWLLVFGVIAGLCGRVLALDHGHGGNHGAHACDHGHDHDHGPTDDHSHEGCPPGPHEHHHSHACCHVSPLAGLEIQHHRLMVPDHVLLAVSWPGSMPPEEPVFALDKPPLI
jgi:hypothetical protein